MNSSFLLSVHFLCLLVFLIQSTNGKPLCDSLEEYFRNRKEPGSGRLKKTITRICTAFDVVKYEGVDPLELLLPPNEDDDIVGGGRETEPSEIEEEFLPEDFAQGQDFDPQQDFIPQHDSTKQHDSVQPHDNRQQHDSAQHDSRPQHDSMQHHDSMQQHDSRQEESDLALINRHHPFRHMQHQGINPWTFHPGFPFGLPGAVWMGSNRRQAKFPKTAAKHASSVEEWESTKTQKSNSSSTAKATTVKVPTTLKPATVKQDFRSIGNGTHLSDVPDTDEEDELDVDDPLLNDLADFVASIRFLSLNDTRHLSVILPESKATESQASAEDVPEYSTDTASSRSGGPLKQVVSQFGGTSAEGSGSKTSLAIEAPDDLLPKSYSRSSPAVDNEAGLPNIHQVRTEFTCEKQLYFPGVYSDMYTDCRVFHLCLPDGYGFRSASFMCPKGLRYSQQRLRCDRARDVDCSASTIHYANNQYFSRNYVDYLHSLKVLLHGDAGESTETDADYASDQNETDESPDSFGNTINTSMLSKLKNVVTETN